MNLSLEDYQKFNNLNDKELEEYIKDKSNRDRMIAYFGEEEYDSLRQILTSKSVLAGVRSTEIILLPGIMGSELADPDSNEKVWVNIKGIIFGKKFPKLESSNDLKAVGLYRKAYFKTIKSLENQGYTVHTFPYDWRKPIDDRGS